MNRHPFLPARRHFMATLAAAAARPMIANTISASTVSRLET